MQANTPNLPVNPTQNILEQLNDIQTPEAIGLWPLAPGWWLLIISSILLIVISAYLIVQYHKKRKQKRQALKALNNLPEDSDAAQLNTLLKRACLAYFPLEMIANKAGEQWISFLTACLPEKKQHAFKQRYQAQYQASFLPEQTAADKSLVKQWLQSALPPNKKTLERVADV